MEFAVFFLFRSKIQFYNFIWLILMPNKQTSQRSIWFFNSSAHMRLFTCSNFLSPARMLGSEWYWTGPDRTKLKCGTGPLRSILGRTVLSLNKTHFWCSYMVILPTFLLFIRQSCWVHRNHYYISGKYCISFHCAGNICILCDCNFYLLTCNM